MYEPNVMDAPAGFRSVPVTRPDHYISLVVALNLRVKGEVTGDWHDDVLLDGTEGPSELPCVGRGELLDTTPSLGVFGVRNMASVLSEIYGRDIPGPVWVADHYRAIADLVMDDQRLFARVTDPVRSHVLRRQATVRAINAWLDTREQVDWLVRGFLTPMRRQMNVIAGHLYDKWLPTVVWQE